MAAQIAVGDIVVAVPVGGKRRQTVAITRIDEESDMAHGFLVSKKHPGDYRGAVSVWLSDFAKEA